MRCSLDPPAPAAGWRRLGGLGLAGCATTASGPSIGRVVVVGGGFGGATAARYLRMWGGNVDVTLVERNASFVSCPMSNLVLGGHKQMADITRGYDGLTALGVKVVQGEVTAVDAAARRCGWPAARAALRPADPVARHRLHDRPGRRPGRCAGQRPRRARLEGRPADRGPAQAARPTCPTAACTPSASPRCPTAARPGRMNAPAWWPATSRGQATQQGAGARRQPRDAEQEGAVRKGLCPALQAGILEYRPTPS
jgi:hypothetical protein